MHKVTKILVKLLSATLLLLIFLPLTLSLALTLDSVQSYVVGRVTAVLAQKVGSHVAIGKVHYLLPRDIIVEDLLIEDQAGDTLISSATTRLRIDSYSAKQKYLIITDIDASDCALHLREMPDSVLNIKQFVDSLSSPNGKGDFRVQIEAIEFHNLDFSLERLKSADKGYGVDLSDIHIEGINAKATSFLSYERVTLLHIEEFSGCEKSGFEIISADGDMRITDGELDVNNMHFATPESQMSLSTLRLSGNSWQDYKDFNANVNLYIKSEESKVAVSDVAYFAPSLEGRTFVASELSGVVTGTVDRMKIDVDRLTFGPSATLEALFTIAGASVIETAQFDFKSISVEASRPDVDIFLMGFGGDPLGVEASKIAERLDRVKVVGVGSGQVDNMQVDLALTSELGAASYNGQVRDITTKIAVDGLATTTNLDLGGLLENEKLSELTMTSQLSYAAPDGIADARINGHIARLGYNSYSYSNIDVDAKYHDQNIEGVVNSHDENLDFDLSALIHLRERPHYDVTVRVEHANLNALNINTRDSISVLAGSLRANIEGRELDDINGSLTLRNASYQYNAKSIYAPVITATARNTSESKYLGLESDFLDVTFNSQSSYEALISYLREGLNKYIPFLYADYSERKRGGKVTVANRYSTLTADFKEFGEIAEAISSGFNIANNTSFNFMVNPYAERFSMRLKSDYIENNNLAATQININASNDNDSLSLYATAADLFVGRNSFSTYTLMAGARNNVVELSTGFRDSATQSSATLGMRGEFDGTKSVDISLLPSQLSMDGDRWMISSRKIVGSPKRWTIDGFTVENGAQRLTLNGTASASPSDSLVLQLDNYDISMITSVVGDLGYSIDGLSSGYVNVTQLLSSPRFVADVKLDSVEVNSIPAPPLQLSAGWDTEQNRARVIIDNRRLGETVATGYYAPSTQRYYANLKTDSLNMALIEPLLKTTISNTRGYADVDVSLRGEGRKASLSGTINAYDLSTKILFTQVEYFVPSALVTVEDNRLSTYAKEMFDEDGNRGLVTFNLSLDHLSNVSYSMRIVPENMLVLNTTLQDNELFYGKLYATGVATIEGDKRGVNMDITATSEPNSSFFMPLMTQSTVASTDFITFVKDRKELQESTKNNFRRDYINERARRTSQASSLNINMALHATPDLDFQLVIDPVVGDIIRARGEGRFNLNIAPQDNIFEMYGDYNITEGSYLFTLLNPISKRFTVDSGSSIQWTGDAIDPLLDIDAVYKVKTSLDPLINATSTYSSESSSRAVPVDCIIHLGDRLAQPSVEFSIEVPTADTEQQAVIANTLIDQETISQQFFYLMFANSFIPVTSSYGSGLASSTTASTGFELLTNQLSNWLSSSNYNVVIRYRPESDLTSDEVDLGFSRGLIDNRLLIEVEGNYLADNKLDDSNYSNFMGEAYITWLIDKAGTFKLKGFTQTIDRYDENQGLQETGIGLYYSESFNTFKELREKIKSRFKRKPKEEDEEDEEEEDAQNDKTDKN